MITNDQLKLLERLGLSQQESAIYLSLMGSGPAVISTIAKETRLHRPVIYQVLPILEKKQLVTTVTKGKRTFFVAESPERLETLLQTTTDALHALIPDLKTAFASRELRPIVKFLEGKKGITFVFDDLLQTLKRGDAFYRYSSVRDIKRADSYLPKNYRKIRDEKKLERFVITSEPRAKEKRPSLDRAIKTIPKEFGHFDYDVTQVIYGNKVAYVDYNSETAFIIENPVVAEFQRNVFKMLYHKL